MNPRIYLYVAALIAFVLVCGGIYAKGRSDGVSHEKAKQQAAIAKAKVAAAATEAKDRATRDEREASYLRRIRELEGHGIAPVLTQPVRLCNARSSVPSAPNSAASVNAASATREPTVQAGDDLGPALLDYGRTCESLRIQLDELEKWASSL